MKKQVQTEIGAKRKSNVRACDVPRHLQNGKTETASGWRNTGLGDREARRTGRFFVSLLLAILCHFINYYCSISVVQCCSISDDWDPRVLSTSTTGKCG